MFYSKFTWFFNIKSGVFTNGPRLVEGRQGLTCAMNGTHVIVGGGALSTRNSMEIWSHVKDTNVWSRFTVSIGAGENDAKLLYAGKHLYLLGGWEPGWDFRNRNFGEKIWKINNDFKYEKVGNMSDSIYHFTAFNIPRGYLTKCQGALLLNCLRNEIRH